VASQFNSVVIVGGGTMGADLAALFSARRVPVQVVCRPGRSLDTLRSRIAAALAQLDAPAAAAEAVIVDRLDAVSWAGGDLVIECLPEDLGVKQQLFRTLEAVAGDGAVLTSNSSGFPVSRIGEGLATQQRMLGLHFFMPAHLVPLVEVILSERSGPAIARRVHDFMAAIGSEPVWVKRDIPGFLANRLQHALMREAWSLIDRGIASPEDVDKAVRYGFGFRYVAAGPVLQKEHSGLDVTLAASSVVFPDLCNDAQPAPVLRDTVAAGRRGMKSGRGFREWTPAQIDAEKARYQRALTRALAILRDERRGPDGDFQ
jgi:3-hydroxybutyryl-CoA dehydrogenase